MTDNTSKLTAVILSIGIIIIAFVLALPMDSLNQTSTINVAGDAKLETAPDKAEVYFTITTLKDTAKDSEDANRVLSNQVTDALKAAGVTKVETNNYNLYLKTEYVFQREPIIMGYQVDHSFKLTTADLDKVGQFIDLMVKSGANRVDNVQFSLSDEKEREFRSKALSEAAVLAKEKAEVLASSLGVKLAGPMQISESNVYVQPYFEYSTMAKGMGLDEAAAPTPISPKDVVVTANVQVSYKIK